MLSNNVLKKLKICLFSTEFHSFFPWKPNVCIMSSMPCHIWSHILWFLSKHIETISHMDHTITLYNKHSIPMSISFYMYYPIYSRLPRNWTSHLTQYLTINSKIGRESFCRNKRYVMFIHKWVKLEQNHETVWTTIFSILSTIVPNTRNGYANNVFHNTIIMWHMQSPLLPCRIDFVYKSSWKSTAIMMIRLNDFRICTETLIPNWLSLDLTNQYEYISGKG